MALRNGHGSGRGMPRIEVLPVDELPTGTPAPQRTTQAVIRRTPDGRTADVASAKALGALGGAKAKGQSRLARRLGLRELPANAPFAPYYRSAVAFRRFQVSRLAMGVGAGQCGAAPAAIIGTASWQLAASRYVFDLVAAGELGVDALKLASQLGNDARQNMLAGHELAAKEAASRPPSPDEVPAWMKHVAAVEAKCAAQEAANAADEEQSDA